MMNKEGVLRIAEPGRPVDMEVTHEQDGTKVDLTVIWQVGFLLELCCGADICNIFA